MTRPIRLVATQLGSSLLLVVLGLALARAGAASRYTELGPLLLLMILSLFAVVSPVWGVFARPWWLYTLLSVAAATLLFVGSFALLEALESGAIAKLGPGGMVFLVPIVIYAFLTPLCGLIQLFVLRFAR
ncbi:MAG: hypothetical protein C4331_03745 [Meiothermus sp.]